MKYIVVTATAFFLGVSPVHAVEMLPGLWEFSSDEIEVNGMQMPGVAEMIEQMEDLPPEQKKMMEDMLAEQGVELGARGMRICLSEAQVKSRKLPFQDEPGCSQEVTEQTERNWTFTFQCDDAKGRGETRLISEREVSSLIESEYRVGDQQGISSMKSQGKWVSTDCGSLEPKN